MAKLVRSKAARRDQAPDARLEPCSILQLKASLADMSYAEQQAAIQPPMPIQFSAGSARRDVHQIAALGVSGSGSQLPHLGAIQTAFGRHDVSNVQAHTGDAARTANQRLGASAYATGNAVAFGNQPTLHTAAHEAAHVVQQRAGVSLSGGIGKVGDPYEQHADRVADAVVAGRTAESLLDATSGPGAGARAVQRSAQAVQFQDTETGSAASEIPIQLADLAGDGALRRFDLPSGTCADELAAADGVPAQVDQLRSFVEAGERCYADLLRRGTPADAIDVMLPLVSLRILLGEFEAADTGGRYPSSIQYARLLTPAYELQNTTLTIQRRRNAWVDGCQAAAQETFVDLLSDELGERTADLGSAPIDLVANRQALISYLDDVVVYLEAIGFPAEGHLREVSSHRELVRTLALDRRFEPVLGGQYMTARRNALGAVSVAAEQPFATRGRETGVPPLSVSDRRNVVAVVAINVALALDRFECVVDSIQFEDTDFATEIRKLVVELAIGAVSPLLGEVLAPMVDVIDTLTRELFEYTQPRARDLAASLAVAGTPAALGFIDTQSVPQTPAEQRLGLRAAHRAALASTASFITSNVNNPARLSDAELLAYGAHLGTETDAEVAAFVANELDRRHEELSHHPCAAWVDLSEFGLRPRLAHRRPTSAAPGAEGFDHWVDRGLEDAVVAQMEDLGRDVPTLQLNQLGEGDGRHLVPDEDQSYADARDIASATRRSDP